MENINDPKPDLLASTGLQVDEESGNHLKEAGQWAKAVAIIAVVIAGLAVLLLFAFGSVLIRNIGFGLQEYAGAIVAVVLVLLAVALIGIVGLFRFGNGMASGVNNQDAAAFDKGIGGLKNYFILIGVLTLLSILFDIIELMNIL